MTAEQIHGALLVALYVLIILAALGFASLVVYVFDRASRSIDEHTRQHRESDECPWCAASDERLLERERQQWRADIAKQRREAAERRMRGAS